MNEKPVVTVQDLIQNNYLVNGETIYGKFKGHRFTAKVEEEGFVFMNGKRYTSISIAAGIVRAQINGPPTDGLPYRRANGWTFWRRKNESGNLEKLDTVRQAYIRAFEFAG